MKLHRLSSSLRRRANKRIGRGSGSGRGGTATKGHKGAQSRSGYRSKVGFEGGQTSLVRRLAKSRGFKNPFRKVFKAINVGQAARLCEQAGLDRLTPELLTQHSHIREGQLYKILAGGELKVKIDFVGHQCSQKALDKIQKAGGSFTPIGL